MRSLVLSVQAVAPPPLILLESLVYNTLNVVKSGYTLDTLESQTSIQFPMQTFADIRRQLIADILDSHLSFDAVRATAEWDELNCLEQMTLEDLIDM